MKSRDIRFPPDSDQVAFIGFDVNNYSKDLAALIVNESINGACFVVNKALVQKDKPLTIGMIILAKIGNLDPLKAEIRWLDGTDHNLLKIGIVILD